MRRFPPIFLLSFAAAVIGPCTTASHAAQRENPPEQPGNPPIEGVLTNEGAACTALRAKDGKLYTLIGDMRGFKPHDQVCVVPDYIDMTYCLQGTTAHVDWIGPGPCPSR
jgi:hypothetical protein